MELKKISELLENLCKVLEVIVASLVLLAVAVGIIFLYEPLLELLKSRVDGEILMDFLGQVLTMVIGIEFFKVLFKPTVKTLMEVIIFVMARHMVIHEASALENLLTVAGICMMVLVSNYVFFRNRPPKKVEKADKPQEP